MVLTLKFIKYDQILGPTFLKLNEVSCHLLCADYMTCTIIDISDSLIWFLPFVNFAVSMWKLRRGRWRVWVSVIEPRPCLSGPISLHGAQSGLEWVVPPASSILPEEYQLTSFNQWYHVTDISWVYPIGQVWFSPGWPRNVWPLGQWNSWSRTPTESLSQ